MPLLIHVGGDEDQLTIERHRQVAICGSDIATFVQELSEVDDVLSMFDFLLHDAPRAAWEIRTFLQLH